MFEETQKKLQEELQKRAEEARKKLEATQSGGRRGASQRGREVVGRHSGAMRKAATRNLSACFAPMRAPE